ncbi:hypothetical protein A374_08814 [Fictibacillus macauensis ZFHKF-1]|uniref:Uncharacterized protein n=1 Tax=Fictibacillus macauensis ZFHKF-1 TaxID=1196324 RepID=I8AK42_9BACL|nr:hypothetical protein [Fictibacillus macauensis]EIT85924.1 hypothetical protein A374_08814 [Fictibacillus macauensis ZFHKF-1]
MSVTYKGKEITLVQDPYIDGVSGQRPHYKATGEDVEGNEYLVTWDVKDNWEEIEDESEMCDWNQYEVQQA